MTHVRTLILGGGMSGLSCAYHLKSDYQLWERSNEPGGLSQSKKKDGFIFDHTGHLLHLRHPYTKQELIPKLLGDNLVSNERCASIYSNGVYIPYPYQANTHTLPFLVKAECIFWLWVAKTFNKEKRNPVSDRQQVAQAFGESFARHFYTSIKKEDIPVHEPERRHPELISFDKWVLRTFGRGFGKHFFFPYNEKLWQTSLEDLTAEWVAPFVPKPSRKEIFLNAFFGQTKKFGYNATFYYPKKGGIQALAFAFADSLLRTSIRLNMEVKSIDLENKEVTSASGEQVSYDHLVTTLPLVRFLDMARPLPPEITADRQRLQWTSVYNLNLGIKRPNIRNEHWIYFPEKDYPFYRVGFPMNFSENMTPRDCSSMYIEIAYKPGKPPDERQVRIDCLDWLYKCRILDRKDEIATELVLNIPIAYVIFDHARTSSVRTILSYLEAKNIHSIGRFGGWTYSYMEDAILEGKDTAEKILG